MAYSPYNTDDHVYVWSHEKQCYYHRLAARGGEWTECETDTVTASLGVSIIKSMGLLPSNGKPEDVHAIDVDGIADVVLDVDDKILAVYVDNTVFNHNEWYDVDWNHPANALPSALSAQATGTKRMTAQLNICVPRSKADAVSQWLESQTICTVEVDREDTEADSTFMIGAAFEEYESDLPIILRELQKYVVTL